MGEIKALLCTILGAGNALNVCTWCKIFQLWSIRQGGQEAAFISRAIQPAVDAKKHIGRKG